MVDLLIQAIGLTAIHLAPASDVLSGTYRDEGRGTGSAVTMSMCELLTAIESSIVLRRPVSIVADADTQLAELAKWSRTWRQVQLVYTHQNVSRIVGEFWHVEICTL